MATRPVTSNFFSVLCTGKLSRRSSPSTALVAFALLLFSRRCDGSVWMNEQAGKHAGRLVSFVYILFVVDYVAAVTVPDEGF